MCSLLSSPRSRYFAERIMVALNYRSTRASLCGYRFLLRGIEGISESKSAPDSLVISPKSYSKDSYVSGPQNSPITLFSFSLSDSIIKLSPVLRTTRFLIPLFPQQAQQSLVLCRLCRCLKVRASCLNRLDQLRTKIAFEDVLPESKL